MKPTLERAPTRLLLVESNAQDAALILEMLAGAACSYQVRTRTTIAAAIAAVAEEAPNIVILDLSLTDSQGLETLYKIQAHVGTVPIVIMSGLKDEALATEAVTKGAQDYLVKSDIRARALQRVLDYSLERHHNAEHRRALERDLAHSRTLEAVGQLAAGVAHEINTPTQYVSDNTQFLRDALADVVVALQALQSMAQSDEPLDGAELRRILAAADVDYLLKEIPRALASSISGLDHIARIVRAMKEFSHPASDEKTPADLNRSLETTIVVASNEWKYVAQVKTELDPDLPLVTCLPGELNQVFLNLIVNAAHAIGEVVAATPGVKGCITVRTRAAASGWIEIQIADTGGGIRREHREKIFEPFFTTKAVGKGTGQGLAIARDVVVRKHGGTIDFESEPGKGTCFTLRLPIQAASQEVPSAAAA